MTQLAIRSEIRDIVAAYNTTCATVRRTFDQLSAAENRINLLLSNDAREVKRVDLMHNGHRRSVSLTKPDAVIDRLRRQVWRGIVERLQLRSAMSEQRAKEMTKQLAEGELPEVTEESVASFAEHYMRQLDDMFAEKVRECFEWLRPRQSRHKTNTELEVGRKVILTHVVEPGVNGGLHVAYISTWTNWSARLTALETAFKALDNKGHSTSHYHSDLHVAINDACQSGGSCSGVTDYFRFRAFKNGNLHLQFLRPDLLRRFNALAGGTRLRPAA